MKEIKILIRQLRSYPDNFLVYPTIMEVDHTTHRKTKVLMVCDVYGIKKGFIEIGSKGDVVIEA